jgi:uncharacterized delta-60 repeat protein
VVLCAGLTCLAVGSPASAVAGRLDSTFGGDGKVTTGVTAGDAAAADILVQPDGKIVAAGSSDPTGSGVERFTLVRYLTDGTLDPAFGGGMVRTSFGEKSAGVQGVALQPDGKIVAAGTAEILPSETSRFAIARYTTEGVLDPSFGEDGKVTTRFFGAGSVAEADAVAVQVDGKIVAAGSAFDASGSIERRFAIARYMPDGTLDPTFSRNGKLHMFLPFGCSGLGSGITDIAIQPDGKIVVAGSHSICFALARYLSDGTLDDSFGRGDGIAEIPFLASGFDVSAASALALQPDGKVLAAGVAAIEFGRECRFAMIRLRADGVLNRTFGGGDGRVLTRFATHCALATDVALQPDGRIVTVGGALSLAHFRGRFAVARHLPDGTLDRTFSRNGKLTTGFAGTSAGGPGCFYQGVALQADGRIVAAGTVCDPATGSRRFALARYIGS